jgi:hypothetical protein
VLSRAAFRKHFDLHAYSDGLKAWLPPRAVERWRQAQPGLDSLSSLFLIVPAGEGEDQISEFKVAWVDSFPALQQIPYAAPLELYRGLELARFNPDSIFVGTLDGESSERVREIGLFDIDQFPGHGTPRDSVTRLRECLGNPKLASAAEGDLHLELKLPLPGTWVDDCLMSSGLKGNRNVDLMMTDLHGISIRPGVVAVSCNVLSTQFLRLVGASCDSAEDKRDGPRIAEISPFWRIDRGLVYSTDRRALGALADLLDSTRVAGEDRQVFSLSELYRNSISRFTYLVQTLDFMIIPTAIFGMFVVIYVLHFQITTWISHRRKQYGVLMARGLHWYEVHLICTSQMLFATLIGFAFAVVFIEAAKWLFNHLFMQSGAAEIGRYQLGIKNPNLLTALNADSFWLITQDHLFALLVIAATNLALLLKILSGLPVRPSTTPIELISSTG